MARGMANNEAIVSQANTKAYEEGYDRAGLGKAPREPGRFVWRDGKLVNAADVEMDETRMAVSAPVIVGRQYENVPSPRGDHVFTGRTDYNRYMKRHNLTHVSDFDSPGGQWERQAKEKSQGFSSEKQRRDRRERIGRRLYEVEKMPQKQYDAQVREAAIKRAQRGTAEPTE